MSSSHPVSASRRSVVRLFHSFVQQQSGSLNAGSRKHGQAQAFSFVFLLGLLMTGWIAGAPKAVGQITAHAGAATTTVYTNAGGGEGLALNAAGDVFTGFDSPIGVYKSTYANGSYTTASIGGPQNYFFGLAVDASGTIYAANENGGQIYRITYADGAYTFTSLFTVPNGTSAGVAVDGYGNLYTNNYSSTLYKYTYSNGTYTQHIIASNFMTARNVAVDTNGVIYQADQGANKVRIFTPNGSVATTTSYTEATALPCTAGCAGVAVARDGTVYIGDGSYLRKDTPNGSGGYVPTIVSSSYGAIRGMAVDNNGNVLVGDLNGGAITKSTTALPDFGSVNLGSTSTAQPISFVIDTNANSTALGTVQTLTQGAGGQDFALSTPNSCTGTPSAGSTCTAYVTFTPRGTGLRTGAVELTDSTGRVLATTFVRGVGIAPQIAFLSAKGVVLSGVPAVPRALAIDGSGSIYDPNATATVYKVSATGSSSAFYTSNNGQSSFAAAAADGAGNVYLVDRGTGNMVEVSPAGVLLRSVATGASVSNNLGQVALDSLGTAYIADPTDGKVIEINQAGAITSQAISGYSSGNGVAIDRNGALYVTLSNSNAIAKVTNGAQSTITPTGAALNAPNSLTVDGGGNLYVTNGSNGIVIVSAAGVGTKLDTTGFNTGFVYGIAVDGNGKLYFPDQNTASINVITLGQSKVQALGSPAVGTSTTVAVPVANIGTAALTFPAPGSGSNPSLSAGLQWSTTSTCPQVSSSSSAGSLAAGSICVASVVYTAPSTANYSGSAVLTDNNLNTINTQAISFTGGGTVGTAVLAVSSLGSYPVAGVPVSVMVSYGGVAPTGAVTLSRGSTNVPLTCTASSYTETCTGVIDASVLAPGSYPLTAQLAADVNYSAASGNGTLTVVANSYAAGTEPVGTASGTETATIVLNQGGTATSAIGLTRGVSGVASDFQVSSFSCNGTTAGSTCTVQYTFKPSAPGMRQGGIKVTDAGGNLLGSTYLSGAGTGPLAAFYPGRQTQVVGNIPDDAFGIAIDGAKNLYYSRGGGSIYKSTLANGTYSGPVTFGSGMSNPSGVAVDGQGNVWIADTSNGRILEEIITGTTVRQTVPFSGLNNPFAVAVDALGNVYIGAQNQLLKETYTGTGYTQTVLDSGLASIISLTTDLTGNLYVADGGSNSLFKETYANGTYTRATISGGLGNVNGVAVDASGNVYAVADNTSNQVLRWAPDGQGGYKALPGVGQFTRTNGVALDDAGNVYVTDDGGGNSIYQINVSAPSPLAFFSTAVGASSAAQTTQISNIGNTSLPLNVASATPDFVVDSTATDCASSLLSGASCNSGVRFAPQTINATTGQLAITGFAPSVALSGAATQGVVAVVTASSAAEQGATVTLSATLTFGGVQPTGAVSFAIGTGIPVPATCTAGAGNEICTAILPTAGLPVGSNTFFVSLSPDSNYLGSNAPGTLTIVPAGFAAPSSPVGTSTAPQTATLVFSVSGTLGSINVVTQGAQNLDFTLAAGGTCTVGQAYNAGDTCTVLYTFTPKASGQRLGGITLSDAAGGALTQTALSGVGNGGLGLFEPGKQAVLYRNVNAARGPVVDALGNFYYSDQGTGQLMKISAASIQGIEAGTAQAGTAQPAVLIANVAGISGVAVDGFGNVYYASGGNGAVYELVNGTGNPLLVANGLSPDNILLADGSGNLYLTNANGNIQEIAAISHAVSTLFSGSGDRLIGLAMDAQKNLYAATFGGNTLYQFPAGNYGNPVQLYSGSALHNPHGIVLDAAGNLYVTNHSGSPQIVRFSAGTYTPTTLAGTGGSGVAIDGNGNLYTTDDDHVSVYSRGSAGLLFGSAPVGTISSDSPLSLGFENDGNAALNLSSLAIASDNFTITATNTTCATGAFAPAGTCVLAVSFRPQTAGSLTGTLNVTDDDQGVAGTTQAVALAGTGAAGTATVAVANDAVVYGGATTTLSAMLMYPGSTAPTGGFAFTVGSAAPVTAICSGSTSPLTCTATYPLAGLAAGNYTITGSVAADTNVNAASGTGTLTVTQATPTLSVVDSSASFSNPSTTLTATLAYAGAAPSGAVSFQVGSGPVIMGSCTGSASPLTCTATYPLASTTIGANAITASLAADTNYIAATASGMLTVTTATATITTSGATLVYGTGTTTLSALVAYTGSTAPTGPVTFAVGSRAPVTGTCSGTTSPLSCTATYVTSSLVPNTYIITASLPADARFAAATGTANLTVKAAVPSVAVTSSTVSYGTASATLSASVSFPGILPSGAITFTADNGTAVTATCTGSVSPVTCTATYPTTLLTPQAHTVKVAVAADADYSAASGTGTLTVTPTTPVFAVAPGSITFATATANLSATLSYTGATPTGPVTFAIDGATPVVANCTGTTSPRTCIASYPSAALATTTHTITVNLAADAIYPAASGTGTLTVTPGTPLVTVANQSVSYGAASATLSASISFPGKLPTGPVSFVVDNGTAVVATCSGTNSPITCTAAYPSTSLSTQSHTVKVSLAADVNYAAAAGTGTLVVNAASPAITVAAQSGSFGSATSSLSASIAFAGTAAPTGTVSFTVDGGSTVAGTCVGATSPLTCTAIYPISTLSAGPHTIAVTLAADVNYKPATGSGTLTVAVTTATISFMVPSHTYGDPAFAVSATSNATGSFTYSVVSGPATVSGSTVTINGVGTVVLQAMQAADANFSAGSKQTSLTVTQAALTASANNATRVYGAANPAFNGTVTGARYNDSFSETFATPATTTSAAGTYAIVPAVTGTDLSDYSTTISNGTLTITQAPTITSLTASAASLNPGQNVTLSASVASTTSGSPTGSVSFLDGTTTLGTVALTNGTAVFNTTSLAPNVAHSLTVRYAGDSNFLASATTLGTPVTVGQLEFTFNTTGATAYTAAPGTAATFGFSLAPNFGSYAGTVSFAVSGLPAGATFSFSPNTVSATGGAVPVVLTVQTPKAVALKAAPLNPVQRGLPVMALLLLPGLGSRRVRRKLGSRMLLAILLMAGIGGVGLLTGCGTSSTGFGIQPASTYTLTVTATSGSLQHTQTVTLTVQ